MYLSNQFLLLVGASTDATIRQNIAQLSTKGWAWDTTIYSAVIAAIVSLLIWSLTVRRENKNKRQEKEDLDSGNMTFLSFLLIGVLSRGVYQMQKMGVYIGQFDGFDFDYEPLGVLPNPDLSTISDRIDQEKYFGSYISIYKTSTKELERLKDIFTGVYFLKVQFGNLETITQNFYDDEAKHMAELSNHFSAVLKQISSLAFRQRTPIENRFLVVASHHKANYHKQRKGESDFNAAIVNFVVPLMNEIAQNYTEQGFVKEISDALYSAKSMSEIVLLRRRGYKSELIQIHNTICQTLDFLKENAIPMIEKFTPIKELNGELKDDNKDHGDA